MAKNNRDRLIDTFLSRNQNRRKPPSPQQHTKRQERIVDVKGYLTSTDPLSQPGPGFAKQHPLSGAQPAGMKKYGQSAVRVPRPRKRRS